MSTKELKIQQRKADWVWLMNQPQGRRLLSHLLFNVTGLHRTSFSTNALSMAESEGKRAIGLAVELELVGASIEGFQQVLIDHFKENRNE